VTAVHHRDRDLFEPEPEPRDVKYTIVSCDDHLVEPRHMFEGRLPARLQARAPRIVVDDTGNEAWTFDDRLQPMIGGNAVAGISREMRHYYEPTRFTQMRRGCWDPDARVRDMDIAGIWASMNFPSNVSGFCGRVYSHCSDPELGRATTRAWNDWFHEEWYSVHPTRFIPLGLTHLEDPEAGATEIRRNADRGFKAVSMPELPDKIGFPSISSDYWDPIMRACAETGTVAALHIGSSGVPDVVPAQHSQKLLTTLFPFSALRSCAEWLWSGYPAKYPELRVAMSEGGLGWVAGLIDRLQSNWEHTGYAEDALGNGMSPVEVLQRNFWFCSLLDPSTIDTRHAIGIENIMFEVDYPHGDGYWPDCQAVIERTWGHIPDHELRQMLSLNAAALFRHPLPEVVLPRAQPSWNGEHP
jgi:predicted TIM-barrel fold metal-dependent hydrolase